MGLYEVQVLDSYGNDTYPDGQAAAIYGQYPPLVNACRPRANGRPTTSGTAIPWRLVPHSERAFSLRYTAGDLEFDLKPDGAVTSLTFRLAGDSHTATRGE
jgi:hypothetical protein